MAENPTRANRLLARMPPSERALLEPHLERVTLDLGDALIKPHEPIRYVWFPETALASLVTVLEDGSTVESGAVGREGIVGIPVFLGAVQTPMQTLVQIPGEMLRLPADVMRDAFARGGGLQALLHNYVHALFIVASQSAACNRKHQVEERLARWLLMSSDGIGSDELSITQEFLATMLGVRRAGVTEAAVTLQERGLIRYSRGHVSIADRESLEDTACECYRIVHDEYARVLA